MFSHEFNKTLSKIQERVIMENYLRHGLLLLISTIAFAESVNVKCLQIEDNLINDAELGVYDEKTGHTRISNTDVSNDYVFGSSAEAVESVSNGYKVNLCFIEDKDIQNDLRIKEMQNYSKQLSLKTQVTIGFGASFTEGLEDLVIASKVAFWVNEEGSYITPYTRYLVLSGSDYDFNSDSWTSTEIDKILKTVTLGAEYGISFTKYFGWFVDAGLGFSLSDATTRVQNSSSGHMALQAVGEVTTGLHGELIYGVGYEAEILYQWYSDEGLAPVVFLGMSYRF